MNVGTNRARNMPATLAVAACVIVCTLASPDARALAGPGVQQEGANSPPDEATPQRLKPIPHPDLTRMEKVIQDQLEAVKSAFSATAQRPHTTKSKLSAAYGELGRYYHAYNFADAALVCYLNAQSLDPRRNEWPYFSGVLYQKKGDFKNAAEFFSKALKVRPEDKLTTLRLAQVDLALNQPELAEPLFERVVESDPNSAAALVGLGKIALSRRDFSAAAQKFTKALALQAEGFKHRVSDRHGLSWHGRPHSSPGPHSKARVGPARDHGSAPRRNHAVKTG